MSLGGLLSLKSEFPEHFGQSGIMDDVLGNGSSLTFDENGTLIVGAESSFNPFNDLDTMAISPPGSPRSTTPPPMRASSSSAAARHHPAIKTEVEEVAALQHTLQNLSPEQQHKLVVTLKESLASTTPSLQQQAPASSPVAMPLASAALGAFLTQYAEARRMEEIPMKPQAPPDARKAIRSQG